MLTEETIRKIKATTDATLIKLFDLKLPEFLTFEESEINPEGLSTTSSRKLWNYLTVQKSPATLTSLNQTSQRTNRHYNPLSYHKSLRDETPLSEGFFFI